MKLITVLQIHRLFLFWPVSSVACRILPLTCSPSRHLDTRHGFSQLDKAIVLNFLDYQFKDCERTEAQSTPTAIFFHRPAHIDKKLKFRCQ